MNKMVDLTDLGGLSQVDMLRVISVIGVPVALFLLSGTVGQLQLVLRPAVGGLALLGVEPNVGTTVSRSTKSELQAMAGSTEAKKVHPTSAFKAPETTQLVPKPRRFV